VLDLLEARANLPELRKHIVAERVVTPRDWEQGYHVFEGATLNLTHTLGQMLYFRPHDEFEEIDGLYLTGGGTHPGSGLPTIRESGRISAGLILKRDAWYLWSRCRGRAIGATRRSRS
jgi:phytoene desaturase